MYFKPNSNSLFLSQIGVPTITYCFSLQFVDLQLSFSKLADEKIFKYYLFLVISANKY